MSNYFIMAGRWNTIQLAGFQRDLVVSDAAEQRRCVLRAQKSGVKFYIYLCMLRVKGVEAD